MENIIIIGDVHGQINTLKALIEQLPKGTKIVFVGDLIDRGINSKEVIQFIIDNNYDCVLGNHEQFMIDSIGKITGNIAPKDIWFKACNGGEETFASYYFDRKDRRYPSGFDTELYLEHIDFLKTLPLFKEYKFKGFDNLVVSHSIIQPFWKKREVQEFTYTERTSILWNRIVTNENTFIKGLDKDYGTNIYNVFGHTYLFEPFIGEHVADIDCGAAYYKKLVALEYPSMRVFEQENIDLSF